jgi:hypothetical protein
VTLTPALQAPPEKKRPRQSTLSPPPMTLTPALQAPPETRKKTEADFIWSAPKQVRVWIKIDGGQHSAYTPETATIEDITQKAQELRGMSHLTLVKADHVERDYKFRSEGTTRVASALKWNMYQVTCWMRKAFPWKS